MKARDVFLLLGCLFLILAISSCKSGSDNSGDGHIHDGMDDDDNGSFDDDATGNDDDDNDDDDNDDDNDDDDDDDATPDLFVLAGDPTEMAGYFRTGADWEKSEVPYFQNQTKGLPSFTFDALLPLGVKSGTRAYVAYNSFKTIDLFFFEYYLYLVHEIGSDCNPNWTDAWWSAESLILALQYIAENQWVTIELKHFWEGSRVVLYDNGIPSIVFNPIDPDGIFFVTSMHFLGQGEGMAAGIKLTTRTGGVLLFSGGTPIEIPMPPGHEKDVLSALWLSDSDQGWAIASTPLSVPPYLGWFPGSAPGALFRYDSGTWIEQPPPSGCEGTEAARFVFVDESFGIAATRQGKYWLLENGQWSCEDMPFSSADIPILHIAAHGHYYLGDPAQHVASLFEFNQGQRNEIPLPEFIGNLYGITPLNRDAPLWAPFQIDFRYPQPLPFPYF